MRDWAQHFFFKRFFFLFLKECTTKSARTSSMVCRGSPLFCNQRRPSRCTRPSRLMAAAHVHRPGTISMGMPNRCQGRERAQAAVRRGREADEAHANHATTALAPGSGPCCRARPRDGGASQGSDVRPVLHMHGCGSPRCAQSPRAQSPRARSGAGGVGTSLNFSAVCTVRTSGEV